MLKQDRQFLQKSMAHTFPLDKLAQALLAWWRSEYNCECEIEEVTNNNCATTATATHLVLE